MLERVVGVSKVSRELQEGFRIATGDNIDEKSILESLKTLLEDRYTKLYSNGKRL
jgi:hypothetical protein